MSLSRRTLIGGGAAVAGLAALPFVVNGRTELLSPGQAREKGAGMTVLTAGEARTLEAFGETLLPGATRAGIAHFVDHHLAAKPADGLLMVRYMDVPPPYGAFYSAGLAALDAFSRRMRNQDFADLPASQATELVRQIAGQPAPGWQGPPSPLFYFVVRSDAVDVVYGTEEGFAKLGVPYMAHIAPPSKW